MHSSKHRFNLPSEACPVGASEDENVTVKTVGTPTQPAFDVLAHDVWATENGLLDQERAAKISGARFSVYRGQLARLERALIQFMLDIHTEAHGYEELLPPFMVNEASMVGTGRFQSSRMMQPFLVRRVCTDTTAEVPVTNFHRDEILPDEDFGAIYGVHPCFRREAVVMAGHSWVNSTAPVSKVELVQFDGQRMDPNC